MSAGRIEAELKYSAESERPLLDLEAAATLGPAALGSPRTAAEVDRYLDTADRRLSTARWACRLRTREDRTIVSLKGPAEHQAGDLVHRRPELEGPTGAGLDPLAWPPSPAREMLLSLAGGEPLSERFRLEQRRIERSVSMLGRHLGVLSLDRVRVLLGDVELGRMLAVELEFSGPVGDLQHRPLSSALGLLAGLTPDPMSKFERALALLPPG